MKRIKMKAFFLMAIVEAGRYTAVAVDYYSGQ